MATSPLSSLPRAPMVLNTAVLALSMIAIQTCRCRLDIEHCSGTLALIVKSASVVSTTHQQHGIEIGEEKDLHKTRDTPSAYYPTCASLLSAQQTLRSRLLHTSGASKFVAAPVAARGHTKRNSKSFSEVLDHRPLPAQQSNQPLPSLPYPLPPFQFWSQSQSHSFHHHHQPQEAQ